MLIIRFSVNNNGVSSSWLNTNYSFFFSKHSRDREAEHVRDTLTESKDDADKRQFRYRRTASTRSSLLTQTT